MAKSAQASGQSIAEIGYQIAKDFGYPGQQAAGRGNANGVSPNEKLNQVRRGQAVRGLGGNRPGSGAEGFTSLRNLTPTQLAEMSDDEFASYMADPKSAKDMEYSLARYDGRL